METLRRMAAGGRARRRKKKQINTTNPQAAPRATRSQRGELWRCSNLIDGGACRRPRGKLAGWLMGRRGTRQRRDRIHAEEAGNLGSRKDTATPRGCSNAEIEAFAGKGFAGCAEHARRRPGLGREWLAPGSMRWPPLQRLVPSVLLASLLTAFRLQLRRRHLGGVRARRFWHCCAAGPPSSSPGSPTDLFSCFPLVVALMIAGRARRCCWVGVLHQMLPSRLTKVLLPYERGTALAACKLPQPDAMPPTASPATSRSTAVNYIDPTRRS